MTDKRNLTVETIKAIETVLSKGDRVEVVPVKDGIKVLRVKRETVLKSDYESQYEKILDQIWHIE